MTFNFFSCLAHLPVFIHDVPPHLIKDKLRHADGNVRRQIAKIPDLIEDKSPRTRQSRHVTLGACVVDAAIVFVAEEAVIGWTLIPGGGNWKYNKQMIDISIYL